MAGTIRSALSDVHNLASRVMVDLDENGKPVIVTEQQEGIMCRSGQDPHAYCLCRSGANLS